MWPKPDTRERIVNMRRKEVKGQAGMGRERERRCRRLPGKKEKKRTTTRVGVTVAVAREVGGVLVVVAQLQHALTLELASGLLLLRLVLLAFFRERQEEVREVTTVHFVDQFHAEDVPIENRKNREKETAVSTAESMGRM
jgi:hypothetical protein